MAKKIFGKYTSEELDSMISGFQDLGLEIPIHEFLNVSEEDYKKFVWEGPEAVMKDE